MRRAQSGDLQTLVALMTEFYAEAGFVLDRERAVGAFTDILADERLGYAWIIEADGCDVGHVILTLRYAMEYGGLMACLDDLYVRTQWRNRGLSTRSLAEITSFCRDAGLRAITVEVGHDNAPAQKVYRRSGFQASADRVLLALPLANPTHVV
jgi:GNAT superfamily N-acetyltransferase